MESKPYKCTKCEVEFGDFAKLWEHMEVCGKAIPLVVDRMECCTFSLSGSGLTIFPSSGFCGVVFWHNDGTLWQIDGNGNAKRLIEGGSKSE